MKTLSNLISVAFILFGLLLLANNVSDLTLFERTLIGFISLGFGGIILTINNK